MFQQKATIVNSAGIHCRPSAIIFSEVLPYLEAHEFQVSGERGVTKLTGILELISMGFHCGEEVTITVNGPKEDEIGKKLVELFTKSFDFK